MGPAAAALTRLLVAGVVALLLPVLTAGPASACSCAQISTVDAVAGSGTARATPALVAEVEAVTGPGRPPYDVPGGLPDDSGEHGLGALGPGAWTLVAGSAAVLLLLGCVGVLVVRADRANR